MKTKSIIFFLSNRKNLLFDKNAPLEAHSRVARVMEVCMKRVAVDLAKIAMGTLLMALAVKIVYEPVGMVTGGISGIGIIIHQMTKKVVEAGIPVWLTNVALNIPIFLWGYFKKGKKFLFYSLYANVIFSVYLGMIPIVEQTKEDLFLSSVIGGTLTGLGLGLVFTTGYSTGGTDLLSSILKGYLKSCSVAGILFWLDALIIISGITVFGVVSGIYAMVTVYISTKIMDSMLFGLKLGKQVWIISRNYEEIAECIMKKLGRGVTMVSGTGMYSQEERKMLLCVVGKRELVQLTELVRENDHKAFVIVQDAKDVVGEGFGQF